MIFSSSATPTIRPPLPSPRKSFADLSVSVQKNIFVMIDETYVEFAPDINAITAVPLTREFTNLMVLRGVSKFFAAPGMRLGYGITGNMDFLAKCAKTDTMVT